ncbi:uncharacterized protein LOC136081540 [Hydra vulgaris]|uniref:Uncharacterized protein LOC136081540 n=1 Tax=Hydra vulgaris TaxID=6087 RepID=A0ABM4C084_HYDVU
MTTILRHVLNMNSTVKKACDYYIDDIFVNESVETAENVAKHLEKFGLQSGNIPWNEYVSEDCKEKMKELLHRLEKEDSVGGKWLVPVKGKAELYCDASSIGLGVVLLIGGVVIEDAAWLRPRSDTHHINISEFDSILRGLNLASKWDVRELTVYSDSKGTVGWLNAVLKEKYRVKTRGISQLLVQRRLNTIKEIAKGIRIIVQWIPSELNLADRLSRIPQKWCRRVCATGIIQQKDIWKVHSIGHLDVDRTLQLCLRNNQNASRKEVSAVIASCNQCNSIDPYSVKWKHGQLSVKQNWNQVALDATHAGAERYLSMIDCGPSRYTVCRKLVSIHVRKSKNINSWIPGIVRKQNAWSFDVETANRVFPRYISHLRRRIPKSHNKKDSFNDGLDIPKDEVGNGKGRYNENAVQVEIIATNKR